MKMLTTFLVLFLLTTAYAQFPVDAESGLVVYTDIIEMPGQSKAAIHEKAKFWLVSTLKSGDNMVELDGSNSDKIVGTGNLVLDKLDEGVTKAGDYYYLHAFLNFKFIIHAKDGRLKYSIENFDLVFWNYNSRSDQKQSNLRDLGHYEKSITERSYNVKKVKEAFIERNTAYIDGLLKNLAQSFTTSMQKEEQDDW